jgi:hypothetical protein
MGFVVNTLEEVLFQKGGQPQHQIGDLEFLYFQISAGCFLWCVCVY